MSGSDLSNAPRPRQCHLKKWPDFQGYGFNLHAEKGKVGQYIGKVDPGSPSAVTGLKENDRIVEVNGVNVGNENHQQVVERIKANPNETKLLVIDKETDDYYREKKLVIRSDQPNVEIRECPDSRTGSPVTTVNAAVNAAVNIPEESRPRVCTVYKWSDFQGYGFQLNAGDGKPGNYIGDVDADSPASHAGLKNGDRIVEVNDSFAYTDSHSAVVGLITRDPTQVKLLVVDKVANGMLENNMTISQLGAPRYFEGPRERPSSGFGTQSTASSVSVPEESRPRVCTVYKWSDFQGYGFQLNAGDGKPGNYIGGVDTDSPASHAGLKEGDRIVEVNDSFAYTDSHSAIVGLITRDPTQVKLLVVDKVADGMLENNMTISQLGAPKYIEGPRQRPSSGFGTQSTASSVSVPEESRPRVCTVYKWSDFQGYGFQLNAGDGKPGNYIGDVDADSPASHAGLKNGDRIVEVNDSFAYTDSHSAVVGLITRDPTQVKLLVVDKVADGMLENNMTISQLGAPKYIEGPRERPGSIPIYASIAKSERELRPRLCVLRIKPDFQGYGFNLHAEKGKPGQFIGKVDAGSPAEAGGLQEGDHIVEINDENISAQSHADVVNRIKLSPSMVRILVVSGDDWTYAQQNNIHVHNGMPLVQVIDPSQPSAVKSAEVIERAEIAPVAALAAASLESDVPQPRYCHLRKWADFDGYGFNLHAEKGQTGHFIGTVDDNSPGSLSGLKQGDKIVEVNGDNVWNESHSVVVQKIKSNPDVVSLLVVDNEAETYYTSKGISVNSGMDNVKFIYGPDSKPAAGQTISAAPVVAVTAAAVVASSVDSSAPKLRLCHLKQWSDFNGYGFNLHVEKGRAGHFIGAVDDSSPAYYAGLRKGDRIAEANGNNVWDASHQETVGIIKARGNNVELLVADPAAEEYYRNKGVSINSSLPNIERIVCPDRNPATSQVTAAPAVAVANASSSSLPSDAPAPRLCVLQKRQDFQGYGFNLMVIKDRPGNYIGSIEQGSPAQISGLIENDKIIEVNGDNILEEPHANVVNKIKSNPNQVALLVLDPKADEYYQNNNLIASSSQANVQRIDPSATSSSTSVAAVAAPAAVAAAAVASTTKAPEHQLRASLLRRWPDFQGYGFNLQAAKNREGNYIGGVDAGSPAYYAGLKDGDRIVEVNGIYAFNETHANVVSYITQDPTQVKMVVMDRAAEQYFQNNNLTVNSQMDNAKIIECPAKRPSEAINGTVETKPSPAVTTPVVSTSPDQRPSPTVNNNVSGPGLNTGLSAAQLREQLRSKKKQDPRKGNMSLQEKKAIYDSL